VPAPKAVIEQVGKHIDVHRLSPDDYPFAGPNPFFH